MPQTDSTWVDAYHVLFGVKLTDADVRAWYELLEADFPPRGVDHHPGWSVAELKAALYRVAEDKRREGHRAMAPQYPHVKSRLIKARYEIRRGPVEEGPRASGCGLCSPHGLVLFWPDAVQGPWTWEGLGSEYSVTVPCRCDRGRPLLKGQSGTTDTEWRLIQAQHRDLSQERAVIADSWDGKAGVDMAGIGAGGEEF